MKKIFAILVLLAVFFTTGCGDTTDEQPTPPVSVSPSASTQQPDPTPEQSEPPVSEIPSPTAEVTEEPNGERAYAFEYNSVIMRVGEPARDVIEALGEPRDIFEAPSCAFDGVDITYFYPGFELSTYPQDGEEYILSVVLTDDSTETPEGVYIGAPSSDVTAAYGESGGDESRATYTQGVGALVFLFTDDYVSAITYSLILE